MWTLRSWAAGRIVNLNLTADWPTSRDDMKDQEQTTYQDDGEDDLADVGAS
jgi:hypothetical protein